MAYNVYVACDGCGEELFNITNQTISITRAEKIAKKYGWAVPKAGGWYCKECSWRTRPAPDPDDYLFEEDET